MIENLNDAFKVIDLQERLIRKYKARINYLYSRLIASEDYIYILEGGEEDATKTGDIQED